MRLKVLGSSGAEFPGHFPPAFLIDGKLLLDGGTIGSCLSESKRVIAGRSFGIGGYNVKILAHRIMED